MQSRPTAIRMLSKTRTGMTLLDVLISIAVMALLAALVLPAIGTLRESSRKVTCSSNLRQIMLAFDDYAITYQYYPGSSRTRWPQQLLPGLGQPGDAEKCPLYACPSDHEHATGQIRAEYHISYSLCDGLGWDQHLGVRGSFRRRRIAPRNIRDGFSHTAGISERLAWPDFAPQVVDWDHYQSLWNRKLRRIFRNSRDYEEYYHECHDNAGSPRPIWSGIPTYYNHLMPPNDNSCIVYPSDENPSGDGWKAVTATSMHPGGVHSGFLDGSVHFVKSNIDRSVWRALGTIAEGEVNVHF